MMNFTSHGRTLDAKSLSSSVQSWGALGHILFRLEHANMHAPLLYFGYEAIHR